VRRSLVVALSLSLLGGALMAPAEAKKKPKPKPPVTFEESGSIALGNPGDFFAEVNVTRQAFLRSCAVPPSQGIDGYVITLPDDFSTLSSNVSITGADVAGVHDLDIFFFDDACSPIGSLNTDAVDEFGPMPAGARYVLVTAFFGVELGFDFKATEARV
jgi:extracellular elastinolytic metalloproteinase